MSPVFVVPYRKGGKNDGNDAEAICEAVRRPSMRFVPIKSAEQQAILTLHRVRQGFVEERTATLMRIRGLLGEFGIVLGQKPSRLRKEIGARLEAVPVLARRAIDDLRGHSVCSRQDWPTMIKSFGISRRGRSARSACRLSPV